MSRNFRPVALALLAALALPSCAKKAAESERTMSPETGGAAAGDDLDALEAMLSEREDQLRALGTTPPGSPALGAATEKRDVAAGEALNAGDAAGEAAGPAVAPTSASPPPDERAERPRAKQAGASDRCVNICELQSSICQLQDQICGLVPRHEGEPRYARACERATADCSVATEACHACS